jgi:hypothetical protein
MAAVRLSCLARNGRSPGEESLTDAVAAQAIEAQSPSGQISQGEAVVARRTASSEKTWLTQKVLRKRAGRPGEEKEAVAQEKDARPSEANKSNDNTPASGSLLVVPISGRPGRSSRSRAAISLKLDDQSFMAPIFANPVR